MGGREILGCNFDALRACDRMAAKETEMQRPAIFGKTDVVGMDGAAVGARIYFRRYAVRAGIKDVDEFGAADNFFWRVILRHMLVPYIPPPA